MCSSKCDYYLNCPMGFQKIEFEFEDVKFSCEMLNGLFDKFKDIKEVRNENKKKPSYPELSFG